MKIISVLTIAIFALLLLGACNTATEPAKSEPKAEQPKVESNTDSKPDETAKNETKDLDAPKETIKPDNLDPNTPLSLDPVISAMVADPKAWEGKEIIVKGKIDGASTSNMKDGSKVVSQSVENLEGRVVMRCDNTYAAGKLTEKPLFKGDHVFKGKVDSINTQYKEFKLKPCEIQTQK